MRQLPFTKMQGLGNDFVVINDLNSPPVTEGILSPEQAQKVCDRRFGIGADQILWLKKPESTAADARMEILNADGSIAEMCGNGIRAVALYLSEVGPQPKTEYLIETLAGIKTVQIRGDQVLVNMGEPKLGIGFETQGELIEVAGHQLRFYEVDMGNPHAVFFVDHLSQLPIEEFGPLVENHPRFPKRTNVEFVVVQNSQAIEVRVWERGAGPTLACGTGACAAAVATLATGRVRGTLTVNLPGGSLRIGWEGPFCPVMMEGPAKKVFQGSFILE
jgi:diaminopimelate epimerase